MNKSLCARVGLIASLAIFFIFAGQVHTTHAAWTKLNSGLGGWSGVAASADGKRVVGVENNGNNYAISNDSGTTWNMQHMASSSLLYTVSITADGTKIAATDANNSNKMFVSLDGGVTWKVRILPLAGQWYTVKYSADGKKLFTANDIGYIYRSVDDGVTWTQLTNSGSRSWFSIAISADGTKLSAVDSQAGSLYTSTDSGQTWQLRYTFGLTYTAITADGQTIFAVSHDNIFYKSIDGGVTWSHLPVGIGTYNLFSIFSSNDGSHLSIASGNGSYDSTDGGASWAFQSSGVLFVIVSGSSDGSVLYAGSGSYIYKSGNTSCPWTPLTALGNKNWNSVDITPDGTKLAVTNKGALDYVNGNQNIGYWNYGNAYTLTGSCPSYSVSTSFTPGLQRYFFAGVASNNAGSKLVIPAERVYVSSNSGTSWFENTNIDNNEWTSEAASADGQKLAVTGDHIYTSTDGGGTWVKHTTGIPGIPGGFTGWTGIAMSADGMNLVATEHGPFGGSGLGSVYESKDGGNNWTRIGVGNHNWIAAAISPDGHKMGFSSSDYYYGAVNDYDMPGWYAFFVPSRPWNSIAYIGGSGSTTVTNVFGDWAGTTADGVYINNKNQNISGTHSWTDITATPDGKTLAASDSSGYVYVAGGGSLVGQNSLLMVTGISGTSAGGADLVSVNGSGFNSSTQIRLTNANGVVTTLPVQSVTPTRITFQPLSTPAGTYTLDITDGTVDFGTTFTVVNKGPRPPVVTLSASQNGSYTVGGKPVYLNWSATNVTSCTGSASPSANMPTSGWANAALSGNLPAMPMSNTTYTLICTGPYGGDTESASVNVTQQVQSQQLLPDQGMPQSVPMQVPTNGSTNTNSLQTSYAPWSMAAAVAEFWNVFSHAFSK